VKNGIFRGFGAPELCQSAVNRAQNMVNSFSSHVMSVFLVLLVIVTTPTTSSALIITFRRNEKKNHVHFKDIHFFERSFFNNDQYQKKVSTELRSSFMIFLIFR
jgi:hypothetical protein